MQRRIEFLVAVSLAIAIAATGCLRDSQLPLAPLVNEAPDSLGRLVFSSPGAPTLFTPAWSGYSDAIYFIEPGRGLRKLHLPSGDVRTLDAHGAYVSLAPSGRAIYYRSALPGGLGNVLKRFDVVTEARTVISDTATWWPVPSNGDGLVAFSRPVDYALMTAPSSGSGADVVASRGFALAFSPDDRELLYSARPYYTGPDQPLLKIRDLQTGVVREFPIPVPGSLIGTPYWSHRGITIPFAQRGRKTLWVRTGGIDQEVFAGSESIDQQSMSWSPGGARLGFLTYGSDAQGRILTAWVIDLETSRVFRVAHGFDQAHPTPDPVPGVPVVSFENSTTFSPDGRHLVFTSAGRIFIAAIEG